MHYFKMGEQKKTNYGAQSVACYKILKSYKDNSKSSEVIHVKEFKWTLKEFMDTFISFNNSNINKAVIDDSTIA